MKKRKINNKYKKIFKTLGLGICLFTVSIGTCMTVHATNDPLQVVNNLSDFIFSLVRAIGTIILCWGIVQVGMALKSHDPAQRASGFFTVAGGIIITFAKEILYTIIG